LLGSRKKISKASDARLVLPKRDQSPTVPEKEDQLYPAGFTDECMQPGSQAAQRGVVAITGKKIPCIDVWMPSIETKAPTLPET
jgi:hypothetical protein